MTEEMRATTTRRSYPRAMIGPGDSIGPYAIVEPASVGRRTGLFRAIHREDRSPALVRAVLDEHDGEAIRAVEAERDTLARVDDPRIPAVLGYFGTRGALVMRDPGGVSLREVQRAVSAGAARLDVPTVLDVLVEVATALRHAHARDAAHGALAPERVLIGDDGGIVLLGLGAPARPPVEAPEQAVGITDARTDQWLLGALALGLLRMVPAACGDDPPATAGALLVCIETASPPMAQALSRMLAVDPQDRFDGDGYLRALHKLAREAGGVSRRGEVAAQARAARVVVERAEADRAGPRALSAPSPEPAVARRLRAEGAPLARTVRRAEPAAEPADEPQDAAEAAVEDAAPIVIDAPARPSSAPAPATVVAVEDDTGWSEPAPSGPAVASDRRLEADAPEGPRPIDARDTSDGPIAPDPAAPDELAFPGPSIALAEPSLAAVPSPEAHDGPTGPGLPTPVSGPSLATNSDDDDAPAPRRPPPPTVHVLPDWVPVGALALLVLTAAFALLRACG